MAPFDGYDGFKGDELREAFNVIAPKDNWKMPIKAKVPHRDFKKLNAAAIFMTGGGLTVTKWWANDRVTVEGRGYYANVGS